MYHFACQAAKLGLRTAVAGKLGKDIFGNVVYRTLEEAGVYPDYIIRSGALKTGISIGIHTGSDRAILTYKGSIDGMGPEDVDYTLLKSVRHLHIGSYFLMKKLQPCYPDIIKGIKDNGGTVSLDTNWDPEETWDSGVMDVIRQTDIVFPMRTKQWN